MVHYEVSDRLCVLRLDRPPLNAVDLSLLEELRAAFARAVADPRAAGIVLIGSSEQFSAGADLGLFRQIQCPEDAVGVSRAFQEALQQVEDSPKPVVAAVAGRVMGSGLELAMACHYRLADPQSTFLMPEVKLGINPGAGGTQRLPRLIGLEPALRMLVTGEAIGARQALELGLLDAICPGEQLVESARALLRPGLGPRKTSQRLDKVQDVLANQAALQQSETLLAGVRSEIIAPRRILDAVQVGLAESFQAGLVKEQRSFAECLMTPAAQKKIYLFFATRQTAKAAELADAQPREISKALVIGMGTMGTGIAQALLAGGLKVLACDQNEAALAQAAQRIRASLEKRVAQGRLSPAQCEAMLARLAPFGQQGNVAPVDVAIESVFEDLPTKVLVIERLERACSPDTILATNTSTISLDVLAEGMQHPERLIGLHFFNPAHAMPLVEVIWRDSTSKEVIATAIELAKRLKKTPVLVRNREGFLVNRLLIPYLKEAFWLVEEGVEPAAVDRAMVGFGFPMGPLELIDMAGLDILVHADGVLRAAFPRHGGLSQIVLRLVEQGRLGQKTGSGVYRYQPGDYTPHSNPEAQQVIAEVRRTAGSRPREMAQEEIAERLVLRIVAEAFYVLEEGLVRAESDVDVAMVLGTGFPDFRGGPVRYARDMGLMNVRRRLAALAARHGERFAPCRCMPERNESRKDDSQ